MIIRTTLALIGNRVATASDFAIGAQRVGSMCLAVDFEIVADQLGIKDAVWATAVNMHTGQAPVLNQAQIENINAHCRAYAISLQTIKQENGRK